jgi:uncharacterized membrane protein YqaE (UPF0057 family)
MGKVLFATALVGGTAWLFGEIAAPTEVDAGGLLGALIVLGFYLLPMIVAAQRGHHNAAAIGVLNILLGWSVLGWVISLVWACTAVREQGALVAPPTAAPSAELRRLGRLPG